MQQFYSTAIKHASKYKCTIYDLLKISCQDVQSVTVHSRRKLGRADIE